MTINDIIQIVDMCMAYDRQIERIRIPREFYDVLQGQIYGEMTAERAVRAKTEIAGIYVKDVFIDPVDGSGSIQIIFRPSARPV